MADAIRDLLQRCLNRIEELQLCEADEREVAALARDLRAAIAARQPEQGDSDCGEAGHAEGKCGNRRCFRKPAQGEAALLTPALAREWLAYEGEDRGPTGFEAAIRAIAEHAPPAPSVPEDTARDAARYRHIRDSIGGGRLVEDFAYSDLDAALDAGIAAAAAAQR